MSIPDNRLSSGAPPRRRQSLRRSAWLAATVLLLTFIAVPNSVSAKQLTDDPAPASPSWPNHNNNLANTRSTMQTSINSRNVSSLRVKWRIPLDNNQFFGVFSTNPVIEGNVIYMEDLNSKVSAVDKNTGKVIWEHPFNSVNVGPNGVGLGGGLLFGTTHTGIFALNPRTGATVWSKELTTEGVGGVDIAPVYWNNMVLVSTVPTTLTDYTPGFMGMVYAMDAATGTTKWTFNTVKDGDLWGHPEINSGGGLWYPPAVDAQGRVFLGIGDPAPFPGTPEYPNGASRPGPNLYTGSVVALDGRTGRLLWFQQVEPHDIRDYDLQASPVVTFASIGGDRHGRREDGQGGRVPGRQRQAVVADLGRQARERHRPAARPADPGLPRHLRRRADADGRLRRPDLHTVGGQRLGDELDQLRLPRLVPGSRRPARRGRGYRPDAVEA